MTIEGIKKIRFSRRVRENEGRAKKKRQMSVATRLSLMNKKRVATFYLKTPKELRN